MSGKTLGRLGERTEVCCRVFHATDLVDVESAMLFLSGIIIFLAGVFLSGQSGSQLSAGANVSLAVMLFGVALMTLAIHHYVLRRRR